MNHARDNRTAVYRLYAADGTLLYVGVTDKPGRRFGDHRKDKSWWPQVAEKSINWYDNRAEAEAAETAAILSEDPAHNILGTPRHAAAVVAARKRTAERGDPLADLLSGDPLLFGGEPEWVRIHYRRLIERKLAAIGAPATHPVPGAQ